MKTEIALPKTPKNIAIAGATGAVGQEILSLLEKIKFPVDKLKLLASKRSVGKKYTFNNKEYKIEELTKKSFQDIDIALFSCNSKNSKELAPHVINSGAILIDNSSAFRLDSNVPLVVPEINPEVIKEHKGIIANPNCSTIILLMAIYPIYKKYPIKKIIVDTYQAVSGAGQQGMEELKTATQAYLKKQDFEPQFFSYNTAFNLFSHDSSIRSSGYNEEEIKMIKETKKILKNEYIQIAPTCIRVPILRAHSEAIHLTFQNEAPSVEIVKDTLENFPGILLVNDSDKNYFPMPINSSSKYECLVGRIRKDISEPDKSLHLFVSGDQLLKGAALNAVQITGLL